MNWKFWKYEGKWRITRNGDMHYLEWKNILGIWTFVTCSHSLSYLRDYKRKLIDSKLPPVIIEEE